jgi:DNA-directed RNA polymerase subunit RPC12/RpoP
VSSNSKRQAVPIVVQGVCFPTIEAAARHHGQPAKLFRKRMLCSGLTPEQALELEPFPDGFVPGKGQFARARGDQRKAVEQQTGLRRCGKCGEHWPLHAFSRQKGEKLSNRCKKCTSAALIKTRYGLDVEAFNKLAEGQGWQCAICRCDLKIHKGTSYRDKTVAVDHCHKTGAVRGLLCNCCNTGLGSFGDNIKHLEAAINYLCQPSAELLLPLHDSKSLVA